MKCDDHCGCNKCKLKATRRNLARLIMNDDDPDAVDEVLAEIVELERLTAK